MSPLQVVILALPPKRNSHQQVCWATRLTGCGQARRDTGGKTTRAYKYQKRAIGERGQQLSDIVKMLGTAASEKSPFICSDALDECVAEHRAKLLSSLNQILKIFQARK